MEGIEVETVELEEPVGNWDRDMASGEILLLSSSAS